MRTHNKGGRPLSLQSCLEEIGMELVALADEGDVTRWPELKRLGYDLIASARMRRQVQAVAS